MRVLGFLLIELCIGMTIILVLVLSASAQLSMLSQRYQALTARLELLDALYNYCASGGACAQGTGYASKRSPYHGCTLVSATAGELSLKTVV